MLEIYGEHPVDLGLVNIEPVEMMFWLYCPIKLIGGAVIIPENLAQFRPIIEAVRADCDEWHDRNVYLTAKTLWVTQDNPGNRRGWHSDGFMSDDLNYVWSSRDGTLFWVPRSLWAFTQNHIASLDEMEVAAKYGPHKTYPDKHLLRLTETVIHRVPDFNEPAIRSFVKVSVSRHIYGLKGNSINHGLTFPEPTLARIDERNCPIGADL